MRTVISKIVKPRTSLFFLKTHKCASSTIQNIIMRFGFKRGLYFVLPISNNYLGNPKPFNRNMVNKFAIPLNKKFNIFAHHTRYHHEEIKEVMVADAAFVTILRDPADMFESLFTFYNQSLRKFNITLNSILTNPNNISRVSRGNLSRFGFNQMLFDLGLEEKYFSSDNYVKGYIKKIDSEFDLVMISEYMEASIVLFADLMKWPLEDVVYLSLNTRNKSKRNVLKLNDRETLHKVNHPDWMLYRHFLQKLHKKIIAYGKDKLLSDVNKLIKLNMDLKSQCVASSNEKGYAQTISYSLRSNNKWLCVYSVKNELAFTNEIRSNQIERIMVLKKLQRFIDNTNFSLANHASVA